MIDYKNKLRKVDDGRIYMGADEVGKRVSRLSRKWNFANTSQENGFWNKNNLKSPPEELEERVIVDHRDNYTELQDDVAAVEELLTALDVKGLDRQNFREVIRHHRDLVNSEQVVTLEPGVLQCGLRDEDADLVVFQPLLDIGRPGDRFLAMRTGIPGVTLIADGPGLEQNGPGSGVRFMVVMKEEK